MADETKDPLRALVDAIGVEDLERARVACDCASEATHHAVEMALRHARAALSAGERCYCGADLVDGVTTSPSQHPDGDRVWRVEHGRHSCVSSEIRALRTSVSAPAPGTRPPDRAPEPFWLERIEDVSGTSGIGTVAQGVIFRNGWCALHWLTPHTSVAFYPSIEEVEAIHGHDGKTLVVRAVRLSGSATGAPRERLTDDGGLLSRVGAILNRYRYCFVKDAEAEILSIIREETTRSGAPRSEEGGGDGTKTP